MNTGVRHIMTLHFPFYVKIVERNMLLISTATTIYWVSSECTIYMYDCFYQCPPGMRQQVLTFYTKLLAHIRQPLLPHINVHRPVQVSSPVLCLCSSKYRHFFYFSISLTFLNQKLIRLCGEVLAAPTENEEIQFLCIVCAKLKQDPYLVNFFLEVSFFTSEGGIHWWHIF